MWFEELDQFTGEEAVRKIEQSVIRGGDTAFKFKSFNPPKSAQNWANKYIKIPRQDRLVIESTYLTVPSKWLGKPFIDDAEFLKETNPTAYETSIWALLTAQAAMYLIMLLFVRSQMTKFRPLTDFTEELTGVGILIRLPMIV